MENGIKLRKTLFNLTFWAGCIYVLYNVLFVYAPDFTPKSKVIWSSVIIGAISLLYAILRLYDTGFIKEKCGLKIEKKLEDCKLINVQAGITAIFTAIFGNLITKYIDPKSGICFLLGGAGIILAQYIFSFTQKACSLQGFKEDLKTDIFKTAINGGAINAVVALCFPFILMPPLFIYTQNLELMAAYGAGAALAALFIITSEIIYNSKSKENRLEGAGMMSVCACSVIGAAVLGFIIITLLGAYIPMIIPAIALLLGIIGVAAGKKFYKENAGFKTFNLMSFFGIVLFLFALTYLFKCIFLEEIKGICFCIMAGAVIGVIIDICSKIYAKYNDKFHLGALALSLPLFMIPLLLMIGFVQINGMDSYSAGTLGFALILTSLLGAYIINSFSSFSGNLIKNSSLGEKFEKTHEILSFSNKNLYITVSIISAISMFISWALTINVEDLDILNPFIMSAVVFGAGVAPFFKGLLEKANEFVSFKKSSSENKDYVWLSVIFGALSTFLTLLVPLAVCLFVEFYFKEKWLCAQTLGGLMTGMIVSCAIISYKNINERKNNSKAPCDTSFALCTLVNFIAIIILVCAKLFIK